MPTSDQRTPQRLPIKLVLPKQGHEKKVQGGGAQKVPFREVSREYRGSLRNQVAAIEQAVGALPFLSAQVAICL